MCSEIKVTTVYRLNISSASYNPGAAALMTIQTLSTVTAVLLLWSIGLLLPSLKARQLVLLLASYLFYASWGGPTFLTVLVASSLINYVCGVLLRRRPTVPWLCSGVGLNVLLLGIFKYLPPMFDAPPASSWQPDFISNIAMPLGVSFWTFQAISYLFDTYREEEIDPTLLEFCLYMAFWPTVTSGPICRLPDMLPQFRQAFAFNWNDVSLGLRRLLQGLIMKFVLAETLGAGLIQGEGVADGFDSHSVGWGGFDVWLLAVGFGFQLFLDFAGYSHMVIGVARIFGFRLPENFNRPYSSTTPSVFWTRWHISLSFWIRDYVFIPLAGMRRSGWWPYAVLILSMVLFGVWHGAKWTFILWGLYHGLLLVFHRWGQQLMRRWTSPWQAGLGDRLSWLITFAAISLGWIFFRANDLERAVTMFQAIVSYEQYFKLSLPPSFYVLMLAFIVGQLMVSGLQSRVTIWRNRYYQQPELPGYQRCAIELGELLKKRTAWWLAPMTAVLLLVILALVTDPGVPVNSFIYTAF
jgi:alginate O-acetyltransferase complex protein AlgI